MRSVLHGNQKVSVRLTIRPTFTLPAEPSRTEPNRTDSAWKTKLRYEMEAFTLHAEQNRTVPSLTERVLWLMLVFTRQPTTDSVAGFEVRVHPETSRSSI
jgi:hypothetical protein